MPRSDTDSLAHTLRRADPDRYFTALFAPASGRAALFTLYGFNHELARAREVAREPALALIRLQWWREVVQGAARAHAVATPLTHLLQAGRLHGPDLLAMLDAREREIEAPAETLPDWTAWLAQGAGSLAVAAARLLGAPEEALPRQRARGAGYGVAGLLRSVAAHARQGRCLLPANLLAAHGLAPEALPEALIAAPHLPPALRAVLVSEGQALLGQPEPCASHWIAAALPAIMARRELAQKGRGRWAVTVGAVRGRA